MADWAPEVAKRDFTVRDGADYDPDRDPYAEALNILGYTLTTTE